jgi:hypothetical protein
MKKIFLLGAVAAAAYGVFRMMKGTKVEDEFQSSFDNVGSGNIVDQPYQAPDYVPQPQG